MAKILIVDDDSQILTMYKSRFEETKHTAETARDGEEGLSKALEFRPDIILLDILMPKMTGLEMLKKLKTIEEIKNTPVVLLTNVGISEEDVEKGLGIGAVAYMIKSSYTSKEVQEKVEEILQASLGEKHDKIPEVKVQIKKEPFIKE